MAGRQGHARVYFRRDGKQVLVVTLHQAQDGGFLEADGPLSLTRWDDEALGESLQTALEQSSTVASNSRLAGAATLKASGEPSPRAFETSFIAVTLTENNGQVLLQGRPDPGLTLSATLSSTAPAGEFARQATRIFQICRDRKL